MPERRVVRVGADAVRPLRAAVLRPGLPADASVYPGDDEAGALHLAAVADGEVVAVASLLREPPPGEAREDGWRLRGMATLPDSRGQGHGGALLRACLEHVRERGGGLLWCNARVGAVRFYERHGFEARGDLFEIAGIGGHYRMLAAIASPTTEAERKAPGAMSERTLVLVKPDGVQRGLIGEVIDRIERKGLAITRLELRTIARDLAEQHYSEHVDKPFYASLVGFITSGPLVAAVVEGPDAVAAVRGLMGATNPIEAVPGSIRGDYALEIGENIVHGSDSPDNGEREIKLFFPDV